MNSFINRPRISLTNSKTPQKSFSNSIIFLLIGILLLSLLLISYSVSNSQRDLNLIKRAAYPIPTKTPTPAHCSPGACCSNSQLCTYVSTGTYLCTGAPCTAPSPSKTPKPTKTPTPRKSKTPTPKRTKTPAPKPTKTPPPTKTPTPTPIPTAPDWMTAGKIHYYQTDPRWRDKLLPTPCPDSSACNTIRCAGCGQTTTAMIASTYRGAINTPDYVTTKYYPWSNCEGTNILYNKQILEESFGFKGEWVFGEGGRNSAPATAEDLADLKNFVTNGWTAVVGGKVKENIDHIAWVIGWEPVGEFWLFDPASGIISSRDPVIHPVFYTAAVVKP